jgi:hypothetical protein
MSILPLVSFSRRCRASLLPLVACLPLGLGQGTQTVPFRASFDTTFTSVLNFPFAVVTVAGSGQALHMGRTTAATSNQTVNVLTGAATATYSLRAANGDLLTVELDAATTFSSSGVAYAGTYQITGGTGRFAGASGTGAIFGSATNTSPNSGFGTFTLDGTLVR